MTIKETVKQVINGFAGNTAVDIKHVISIALYNRIGCELGDNPQPLTNEQVRRALRDLKHVKRINGRYVVKGRRVPLC